MPLAFKITETMRGAHHFVDPTRGEAIDRPMHFVIDWGAPIASSINPLSQRFMSYAASGVITVDGLTSGEVPCEGSLEIDYLGLRKIVYELVFQAGGQTFRYKGEKTNVDLLRPLQLVKTHTTCYGSIVDESGHIVSKSVVHFEPETMWPFLSSFRLRRATEPS
jgi:hypothetical protein